VRLVAGSVGVGWWGCEVMVLEAVAVALEGEDLGVVDEPVDHRGGGGGVEVVDVDFVEAEIVDQEEAIAGRDGDAVGVRGLLAVGVGAVTGVLLEGDGGAEMTVVADGEGRCAAATVVCRENRLAGGIDSNVACATPERGDLVDLDQPGIFFVEGVAGDGSASLAFIVIKFVGNEDHIAPGTEGEEGRVVGFGCEADLLEIAGGGVEGVGVDTFAGACGLRAYQQEIVAAVALGLRKPRARGDRERSRTVDESTS